MSRRRRAARVTAPRRAPRTPTSAAPIRPASSPSSASTIRSVSSAGWIASARAATPRRLEHEVARSGAEAAADDRRRPGSKMFASDPIAAPEQAADLGERRDRRGVARPARARRARGASAPAPYSSAAARSAASPEACSLEMPAPVAVPLARRPVGDDDDVPELGPAAVEAVVDHEPAADAGAEREHDEVGRAAPRPEPPLGERRRVAVVLDAGRQAEALPGAIGKWTSVQRQVDRAEGDAGAAVDVERHAVADRAPRRRRAGRRRRRRSPRAPPPASRPASRSRSCGRSSPSRATRPARIFVPPRSTPITRSSRTSRLRYPPGCPNKRSPTGCTRAVGRRARSRCSGPRPARREESARRQPRASPPTPHSGRLDHAHPGVLVLACSASSGSSRATSRSRSGISDANARVPAPGARAS